MTKIPNTKSPYKNKKGYCPECGYLDCPARFKGTDHLNEKIMNKYRHEFYHADDYECPKCENSFIGKGYCEECGNYDECYYRICDMSEDDRETCLDFARDMQNNKRFDAR